MWNPSRNAYTVFSQDHAAKVWLRIPDRAQHDAVSDACISVALFNAYRSVQWDPMHLYQMQQAMLSTPLQPSFSVRNPSIDGCW